MLLQFKFANYRSFADETVFDMTATPIREHKNSLIERNGVQVLPVAAIYGANASGKSSFIMALGTMCSIVAGILSRDLAEQHVRLKNHLNTFIFEPKYADKPTEYEVCFAIKNYEYRYGFEHTGEKIICEYLYRKKFTKNKAVEKIIFERSGGNVASSADAKLKKEIDYCASMLVDKSLLLTDLGRRAKEDEFREIFMWFENIASVHELRMAAENISEELLEDLNGHLFSNDNPHNIEVRDSISKLICEIDEGIVSVKPVKKANDKGYSLISERKYNGKIIDVPFLIESDGTKRTLMLSYFIFTALKLGFCCLVDELDLKLHPLLLRKIVHMFKNKDINKHEAQLIFSAHNIINLDSSDLRRDEVWFVEKQQHKSTIFSLYDFEDEGGGDIRSDLDYGKHYLLGRFGAIPFQDKGGVK